MQKKKNKKTQKDRHNPESSHPYTQRQLVLERKLKTTCPQVHQSTPTAHSGYIFLSKTEVMHFVSVQKIRIYTQLQITHQTRKIQVHTRKSYRSKSILIETKYKCTEHTSIS